MEVDCKLGYFFSLVCIKRTFLKRKYFSSILFLGFKAFLSIDFFWEQITVVIKRWDLDPILDEKMNCLLAWVTLDQIVLDKTHYRAQVMQGW